MEEREDIAIDMPVGLNEIAKPMANKKLRSRISRLLQKSVSKKNSIIRGLKNVQGRIRKGDKGLCILAGDVFPIDIYSHLPIVCEDNEIPYCFVPSKRDISVSLGVKRPCIVALVKYDKDYEDIFEKCRSKMQTLCEKKLS